MCWFPRRVGPTARASSLRCSSCSRSPEFQVTALHVDDDSSLPSYSDQTQHETETFAREFVARNLPPSIDIELALRVGRPGAEVLAACDESTTDLVVVAWSRDLSPGRAGVVRQLLERTRVPVMLVPEHGDASQTD